MTVIYEPRPRRYAIQRRDSIDGNHWITIRRYRTRWAAIADARMHAAAAPHAQYRVIDTREQTPATDGRDVWGVVMLTICLIGIAVTFALWLAFHIQTVSERTDCENADGTYVSGVCIDNEAVIEP